MLCALAMPTRAEPRVGAFTIEGSAAAILGDRMTSYERSVLDIHAPIVWDVYAPPASQDTPPGLLVFVSPSDSGPPPARWTGLLDKHNLIWISARKSGNRVPTARRVLNAVIGMVALEHRRMLDHDRYYVSGFSGGGRAASIAIAALPAAFDGAIYFCGANFWATEDVALIGEIKRKRYVFVTGRHDFNRRDMRHVFNRYKRNGVANAILFDLNYLGHELPRPDDFERAIEFLDDRTLPPDADESR